MTAVARSVTGFATDLYHQLAAATPTGNLVCSPYSVAVALAMTVQGARGETAAEILRVLHAQAVGDDPAVLAAGAGGLARLLRSRARHHQDSAGAGGAELAVVDGLWGQRGLTWRPEFLECLTRDFGTGVHEADFATAPEASRARINGWVAEHTRGRITELIPPDAIGPDTTMALLNALYLKAGWSIPFPPGLTRPTPFTRLDGTVVAAQLMRTELPYTGHATGAGWVAVDLPYLGGELAMTVVVPDPGRLPAVEAALDGAWLAGLRAAPRPVHRPPRSLPTGRSCTCCTLWPPACPSWSAASPIPPGRPETVASGHLSSADPGAVATTVHRSDDTPGRVRDRQGRRTPGSRLQPPIAAGLHRRGPGAAAVAAVRARRRPIAPVARRFGGPPAKDRS